MEAITAAPLQTPSNAVKANGSCQIEGTINIDVFFNIFETSILEIKPKYINFFENPVTVQFDHRILGLTTFTLIILIWFYARLMNFHSNIKTKTNILLIVVLIQVCLGITTLLSYVAILPAIVHQLGSLVLFTISIWILKLLSVTDSALSQISTYLLKLWSCSLVYRGIMIPFQNEEFDIVLSGYSLRDAISLRTAISEIHRVLKKNW